MAEAPLAFGASPAARMLPATEPRAEHPLGAPVAQVLDTYVIAVAGDGSLVLVDQHAAHERLTHEALREQMLDWRRPLAAAAAARGGGHAAGRCLAPAGAAATNCPAWAWRSRHSGPARCWCARCPRHSARPSPAPLLRDLADELEELDEATALAARLDAVIARLACHGSIRAGRRLNGAEMDALLRQMEATPRAATCSHGRPTFLKLTKAEIEKLFGRR